MLKILSFLNKSSDIIGIDLGTTNSVVSVLENGSPKTLQNAEGQRTTLSVVAISEKGEILIGDPAQRQAVVNPYRTIYSAKRFIGCTFEEAKSEGFKMPFTVRPDQNGMAAFEIDGKLYLPQDISAHILGKLKLAAEDYLGKKVTKAVITVPAYFNDSQRQATKDAAAIAGLEVAALINEPTAAALDYAQDIKDNEIIFVFDFGGGTFDISILKINENVFEVLATGGNNHLGGDNIDEKLMGILLKDIKNQSGKDISEDKSAIQRLKEAAVKAKIELSSQSETTILIPYLSADFNYEKKITRDEFEKEILSEFADLCIDPIAKVIESAGISKSDIDRILLVGGSTRIPIIQKRVSKFFGKEPLKNVDIDEIVSHGAAVQGGIFKGEIKKEIFDVTSLDLGVDVIGNKMSSIIPANHRLPTEKTKIYETVVDNQSEVEVTCRQGTSKVASENHKLATFLVEGIEPAPAGEKKIHITFKLDGNGILVVFAKDEQGHEQTVTVKDSGQIEKKELERRIKEHLLTVDEKKKLNLERQNLNREIKEAETALAALPSGEKKEKLETAIREADQVLQSEIKPKALALTSRQIRETSEED